MGKRRITQKQIRQVRRVKPKGVPVPAAPGGAGADAKRQRERYVQGGGMLQGYAPEFVVRVGYYAAGLSAACLVIAALLVLFLPYGLPVRVVAALVWLLPIAFLASFIVPGFRLALKDRKSEPRLVQGQLMGASPMSTSIGLGMLMVKTRGGVEQYLVAPDRISKVPGNQVPVMLTVTPNLRHVRSVGVMGPKMVGRPDQPVPDVVRRLRVLPILTPLVLSVAAIAGDDVVALLPIGNDLVHTVGAVLAGGLLAGGVYGVSFVLQKRMYREVQALMPGGAG